MLLPCCDATAVAMPATAIVMLPMLRYLRLCRAATAVIKAAITTAGVANSLTWIFLLPSQSSEDCAGYLLCDVFCCLVDDSSYLLRQFEVS